MSQNQNTPPPNQNQNTPPPNQRTPQSMLGFGPYMSLLHQGTMSPGIPNQPLFTNTSSPPILWNQIPQTFNTQNATFNQNFNNPQTFLQPEFEQPNFYGGSSSASMPRFPAQESTPEEVPEVVPETQPPKRATKGKKKTTRAQQRAQAASEAQDDKIAWTDEELVALADAWCTTSQNEIKGTDQRADGYWKSIRAKFLQTLGKPENYRTVDSLTSKWTQMKAKLTKFNGIYMRLSRNVPSGWNEIKLLDECHKMYKLENRNNAFTLKLVWDRIRFKQKWKDLDEKTRTSSGSKRSRVDYMENSTGSDAHVRVNLNEASDAIPDDEDDVEEVDPLHTRPPRGRDKAKRIAKFGDMSEAKAKHREKIEKSMEAHMASVEEKKAMREQLKAEHAELIEQQRLINHLTIMEKGGIEEEDVEIVKEAKASSRSWLKKFFKK